VKLTHVIFDLDNTLYQSDTGLLQALDRRIQRWTKKTLKIGPQEAVALRKAYYQRYGTTLGGLIAEHDVDIRDYLAFVHDVPVAEYLRPNPALAAMLDAVPLSKAVFTNAPAAHGRRVISALGLDGRFEHLIGIEEVEMCSKPHRLAYQRALSLIGAEGPTCVMVEDNPANLLPAKELGMTTVLIGESAEYGVDFAIDNVIEVGSLIAALTRS
jgi:putative hydrolase of the HAD superfamily